MDIYIPYTYLIGWSKLDLWYYGARWASNCHPDDLFITYFTSSKQVKKIRNKHGDPDIIQIRKTFETAYEARNWESKVLQRMKVIRNPKWLNQHDSVTYHTPKGELHHNYKNQNVAEKVRIAMTGKPKSKEHIEKLRLTRIGKINSKESREKNRIASLRENLSPETLEKMSKAMSGENNPMYGKKRTPKMLEAVSIPVNVNNHVFKSITECIEQTGISYFIINNYIKYGIKPQRGKGKKLFEKLFT